MNAFDCSKWNDEDHWKSLCPSLTVGKEGLQKGTDAISNASLKEFERRRKRLVEDGYVLADNILCGSDAHQLNLIQKLREGITVLHKDHSIPATFILLFDQTWELAQLAKRSLGECTHTKNVFNFDVLAWYIDPSENVAGFSPHRDRQPEDAPSSFHKCQQAKYVTMWTALSEATPENSCLYVIPKQFDPGYTLGDDALVDEHVDNTEGGDPLSRALTGKEAYQHIRALPRKAGESVLFTHRIMHWGSRGNPHSHQKEPRIAISFVCSDPEFEKSYVDTKYFEGDSFPPFRIRLLLVCAQLLIYYQRFDLPKDVIRACYEYCKENSDDLDEEYRKKVFVEFVKAMKEAGHNEHPNASKESTGIEEETPKQSTVNLVVTGPEDDSDEEDAMMQEMLDAEDGGYGEFEDDYDEQIEDGESEEAEGTVDDDDEEPTSLFGKRAHNGDNSSDSRKKTKLE